MKTVVIKECESIKIPNVFTFDLTQMAVKDCIGCWTCWGETPGRCAYKGASPCVNFLETVEKN